MSALATPILIERPGEPRFCEALGLPMRLSAHGVPEDDLPAMAEEAHAVRRLLDNNPRDISAAQILTLHREAF